MEGLIGRQLIKLHRVPSTNDYLKNQRSNSTPLREGTVIMAVEQYGGRGQAQASWHAEAGKNLTFSVLLTPHFLAPIHQFQLTMAISVGLCNYLESRVGTDNIHIKWPNDLYVGSRKIAGILIENNIQGKLWRQAIVGIGLNVNQIEFPEILRDNAVSLKLLSGGSEDFDLDVELDSLCAELDREFARLKTYWESECKGENRTESQYLSRLYLLNEPHVFHIEGIPAQGAIRGVTPTGRLIVDFDGHMTDFGLKEIVY